MIILLLKGNLIYATEINIDICWRCSGGGHAVSRSV